MTSGDQLIGVSGVLISSGIVVVLVLLFRAYIRKENRRATMREWFKSDAVSAKIYRYVIYILMILTMAHIVLTIWQRMTRQ